MNPMKNVEGVAETRFWLANFISETRSQEGTAGRPAGRPDGRKAGRNNAHTDECHFYSLPLPAFCLRRMTKIGLGGLDLIFLVGSKVGENLTCMINCIDKFSVKQDYHLKVFTSTHLFRYILKACIQNENFVNL